MQRFRLILFLFFLSVVAKAQVPFSRDYVLNESATSAKINALAQDDAGYIWLATDAGLYSFNGQVFTKVKDSINKPVTAIAAFHDRVVAGYANGKVAEVFNGSAIILPIKNAIPSAAVNYLYVGGEGIIYACTSDQGLFAIVNNIGFNLNADKGLSDNFIYNMARLSGSRILLGSDDGISDIEWKGKKAEILNFTTSQGLPDNIVRTIKSIPNTSWYWLGTQEGGIALYDTGSHKIWVPEMKDKWMWGQVNDIISLSAKQSWVITESGYLIDLKLKDSLHVEAKANSFKGKKLQKSLLDKAGNIWVGTDQGLTMITSDYISYIKLNEPYSLSKVTAIVCDKSNTLWFAQNNELYRIALGETERLPALAYNAPATITSLYADMKNRLWIGTFGKGLWYIENSKKPVKAVGPEILNNESILNIAGTANSLWIAGLNGVEELSYPTEKTEQIKPIRHHDKDAGIGTDYVYQLYPDREGNMWMATDGAGVCKYDGKVYRHWDFFTQLQKKVAYTVTQDISGDMWLGTYYKDLYRLHNNKWENLRLSEIPSNLDEGISSVISNGSGQVISVYQKCIDEWYPNSRAFRHFNRRLGLGIDSTSNVLNCVAKDTSGNVYVPFEQGMVVFNSQNSIYDIRPGVHIANTSIYLKGIAEQRHRFAYDENDLSFHFDGINFTNPDRLNFRYMLLGYKERWINTNDESVTFPQLPPGSYTFRVQASLNNDFTNAREDAYSFEVGFPFWRKAWFVVPAFILLVVLGNIYIRLREKRLKKMSRLQQERMMFEYEHLKSQVNPHFLFNSLNTLASLIEENKDAAVEYTVQLSDLYRNMLAYRNRDLVLLSEEWEILENYIFIQKSRFGDALQIKANVPQCLMDTKKVIPLALQLLVENAIKHNIVSNSQPLIISIGANENEITVTNKIQAKMSKEKSEGIGLVNINNRYKLLTDRRIIFGVKGNEFAVTLPLL